MIKRDSKKHLRQQGQMSLVFLFLIALGLIFTAMIINWGAVSQTKAQVHTASIVSGAGLASSMGSYGYSLIQSQLGGKLKVCGWTGFALAIITFIVVIVVVVVSIFTVGLGTPGAIAVAVVAIAAAAANVAMQGAEVQPKITSMWNKLQAEMATSEDRFAEGAVSTALGIVVSDSVKMTDDGDYNMNWDANDKIGRFAYLYTERLRYKAENPSAKAQAYVAFKEALEKLAEVIGLDAPKGQCVYALTCCESAICNPCCTPKGTRPTACSTASVPEECYTTPYPGHYIVYDPVYCFRDKTDKMVGYIGQDDSFQDLAKNEPNQPFTNQYVSGSGRFQGWDSESVVGEEKTLFPFLWTLRDTVVDTYQMSDAYKADIGSHWCHEGLQKPEYYWDLPGATEPLFLDPLNGCTAYPCADRLNGDIVLDGVDTLKQLIYPSSSAEGISEGYSGCPMKTVPTLFGGKDPFPKEYHPNIALTKCEGVQAVGSELHKRLVEDLEKVWRPGSSFFCSGTGLSSACSAHGGNVCFTSEEEEFGPENKCGCSDAGAFSANWYADDIDNIVSKISQLYADIRGTLETKSLAAADEDFYKDVEDGAFAWLKELELMGCKMYAWEEAIKLWEKGYRLHEDDTYSHAKADAWCVELERPVDMSDMEYDTILAGGPWGEVGSIEKCYEFQTTYAKGTALDRFRDCRWACASDRYYTCIENAKKVVQDAKDDCDGTCSSAKNKCKTNCTVDCPAGCTTAVDKQDCEDRCAGGVSACESGCDNEQASCQGTCEEENDPDCDPIKELCAKPLETCWGEDIPGGTVNGYTYTGFTGSGHADSDGDPAGALRGMPPDSSKDPDELCSGRDRDFPRSETYRKANLGDVYDGQNAGSETRPKCDTPFMGLAKSAHQASRCSQPKFDKRGPYLTAVHEMISKVVDEKKLSTFADEMKPEIENVYNKLVAFINAAKEQGAYPPVIYVWQNEAKGVQERGTWHAVKVEVSLPKREGNGLQGHCTNGGSDCGPQAFPWIKSKKTMGGLKRCYSYKCPDGVVGVKVTRYDEGYGMGGLTKFANGLKLWGGSDSAAVDIQTACGGMDEPAAISEGGAYANGGCLAAAGEALRDRGISKVTKGTYTMVKPGVIGGGGFFTVSSPVQYEIKLE